MYTYIYVYNCMHIYIYMGTYIFMMSFMKLTAKSALESIDFR